MNGNVKLIFTILLTFVCVFTGTLAMAEASGLGTIAGNITSNLSNVAKLITAGSYVAGMGFAVGAVLKFKAHKDNPTQIPVGTPIALLFVAAALIFMPSIFKASGQTMFGASGGSVSGVSGITKFK